MRSIAELKVPLGVPIAIGIGVDFPRQRLKDNQAS